MSVKRMVGPCQWTLLLTFAGPLRCFANEFHLFAVGEPAVVGGFVRPVNHQDDVGVLLDAAAVAQVVQLRARAAPPFALSRVSCDSTTTGTFKSLAGPSAGRRSA